MAEDLNIDEAASREQREGCESRSPACVEGVSVGEDGVSPLVSLLSTTSVTLTAISPWRRPLSWFLDRFLVGYQRWISPLFPPACRFYPSCSSYARGCLSEHILPRALLLIVWRLLRCQPLCPGGHDPVPPRRSRHHRV